MSAACPATFPAAPNMKVVPAVIAVIVPPAEIDATPGDEDDHDTSPVAIDALFWSSPVALACVDCPT